MYRIKHPQTYQVESAKQALAMYDEALNKGLNICLESTLAGRGTMRRIMAAKKAGYHTIAYYIGLNSVELNLERIRIRVSAGGHDTPEDTVRRRFTESVSNLVLVNKYLDDIYLIDNSEPCFRLQYRVFNNKQIIAYTKSTEVWANQLIGNLKS